MNHKTLLDKNLYMAYRAQSKLFSYKFRSQEPRPFFRYVIIAIALLFLCSCAKEVSKPTTELSLPNRPEIATVQAIVDPVTYARQNIIGWQFNTRIMDKAKTDISFWYEWKQKGDPAVWKLKTTIPAGYSGINHHTMIGVTGEMEYIRLYAVEGTDRKFNLLMIK